MKAYLLPTGEIFTAIPKGGITTEPQLLAFETDEDFIPIEKLRESFIVSENDLKTVRAADIPNNIRQKISEQWDRYYPTGTNITQYAFAFNQMAKGYLQPFYKNGAPVVSVNTEPASRENKVNKTSCEQHRSTKNIAQAAGATLSAAGSALGCVWYHHYKKKANEKTSGWGYFGWFLLGGILGGAPGAIAQQVIANNVPDECLQS